MVTSRVVRIDEEVWAELQSRAVPLEDNPNSVLRKILGLPGREPCTSDLRGNKMDIRISKLINMVGESDGRYLSLRANRSGYYGISSDGGKVFGYLYPQRRRLKVEIRKDWAERASLHDWEQELRNGWHNTGISSVYWFIPNENEDAYNRIASLMKVMRRLNI